MLDSLNGNRKRRRPINWLACAQFCRPDCYKEVPITPRHPCPSLCLQLAIQRQRKWSVFSALDPELQEDVIPVHIGVDEAGRGPLAGPLVVCASVIPPDSRRFNTVCDSKLISTHEKRIAVNNQLKTQPSLDFEIVHISNEQIDQLNILEADRLGMTLATTRLMSRLRQDNPRRPIRISIDGNDIPPALAQACDNPYTFVEWIIGGDGLVYEISAASVLAKVDRDRYMIKQSALYPQYGWASNKGYGSSPAHQAAIRKYGLTPLHRREGFASKFLPSAIPRCLKKK